MPTSSLTRLHAIIHGRVQGVSFRYYTQKEARRLSSTGWVRNCPNRTVETLAEGEQPALEAFQQFLYNGSPSAQVEKVEVSWEEDISQTFSDFTIRHF